MPSTKLQAFLNSIKPGLNAAMIYPFADQKFLRLAIDVFILNFAYDDPFDEEALRLDESAATEFTNTTVSAITDIENFQPVPNMPVITAFHEYVFFPQSPSYQTWGGRGLKSKIKSPFWRTGFCAVFSIAFSFVFGPSRRRADINDTWTIRLSGSYLWRAKSGCARRRSSPVSKNTCSFVALRWQWRYLVFF